MKTETQMKQEILTDSEISDRAHSLNLVSIQRWQSYYDGARWARDRINATQQTKELFTKEDMISFAVWYNDKPYAECRNKTLDDLFNEYKKK